MAEYEVTVTFTAEVEAESAGHAQSLVGDRIRETFSDGEDVGAILGMHTRRVETGTVHRLPSQRAPRP